MSPARRGSAGRHIHQVQGCEMPFGTWRFIEHRSMRVRACSFGVRTIYTADVGWVPESRQILTHPFKVSHRRASAPTFALAYRPARSRVEPAGPVEECRAGRRGRHPPAATRLTRPRDRVPLICYAHVPSRLPSDSRRASAGSAQGSSTQSVAPSTSDKSLVLNHVSLRTNISSGSWRAGWNFEQWTYVFSSIEARDVAGGSRLIDRSRSPETYYSARSS